MSRVKIYDLTKELTPEQKKILEVARRMGILLRAPHGFGADGGLDMTDKPDKSDKPDRDKSGGEDTPK